MAKKNIFQGFYLANILLLLFINNTFSQKQYNVWTFGKNGGIDFNGTQPKGSKSFKTLSDNVNTTYTASVCDTSGKLLLYTDGTTVWNRYSLPIERYKGRWPWSLYCAPLIVPHPENDSLFYIFGVSKGSYANRLQYLTVNALNNIGYGEIIYPQPSTLDNYYTVLKENASVVIAGTAHCNKKDTWIVTYANQSFYSYLITKAGVSKMPVISPVPQNIMDNDIDDGNIKFSASGEKLLVTLKSENAMAVLDFDSRAGTFSNPVRLAIPKDTILEDAEISPDGTKLYAGVYTNEVFEDGDSGPELHSIYQMNLEAGNADAIEKSLYNVTVQPDRVSCGPHQCFGMMRTLQLGPDGKIYTSLRYVIFPPSLKLDKTAGVIENPNDAGINARYIRSGLEIGTVYYNIFYNYIRSSSYTLKKNGIQYQKNVCADRPVQFSLLLNKVDSVRWNFGDPGLNNFSSGLTPQHQYPKPGSYKVSAIIYNKCISDTAFADVSIEEEKSIHIPAVVKDSTFCKGNALEIDATTGGAISYLWNGGNTQPVQTITVTGTYSVTVTNSCSIDQKSFSVNFKECTCDLYIPTAFTPNGDGLNDHFRPIIKCVPHEFTFIIYNRFGNVVFKTADYNSKGWDGKIKNEYALQGAYVWVLNYTETNGISKEERSGTVILLR